MNIFENIGVVNLATPFPFDRVSPRIGDELVAAAALFMIVSCILVASFGRSFGGSFDGPASSRLNADMSSFVSGTWNVGFFPLFAEGRAGFGFA